METQSASSDKTVPQPPSLPQPSKEVPTAFQKSPSSLLVKSTSGWTLDSATLRVMSFMGEEVRWLPDVDNPQCVGADICKVLGLRNSGDALSRLDGDERMTIGLTDSHSGHRGGAQGITLVNESGIYSLILRSRKPKAKELKRWVTHEVLPAIRKTGRYDVRPRTFREVATEALSLAGEEVLALEHKVREQRPKVEFYDLLVSHGVGLDMGQCARAINAPGVTRRTLYALMRQEGVLFQNECGEDELDHQYIDEGLFAYENAPYYRNGFLLPHQKPVAMPAGLDYLKELVARRDDSGIFDTPLSFLGPTESK